MKILLINNNPVVSRLTALSARKEEVEVDEIQEVTELKHNEYDIVFVDSDSLTKDVSDVMKESLKVKKSVLFYAHDDDEITDPFDLRILKPFLPSEVSAVLRSVEEEDEEELLEEDNSVAESHLNILDEAKNIPREELFSLDDDIIEKKKEEVVVMPEKIESFDLKLEETPPLVEELIVNVDNVENVTKEVAFSANDTMFELDLSEDKQEETPLPIVENTEVETQKITEEFIPESEHEDKSEDEVLFVLDNEIGNEVTEKTKSDDFLSDGVLDFDDESEDEVDLSDKKSVETPQPQEKRQVLDMNELANIKELLNGATMEEIEEETKEDDVRLEDLMDSNALLEKKKKNKKIKNIPEMDSEFFIDTLASLRTESLRELLAGATVHISIKFPKAK